MTPRDDEPDGSREAVPSRRRTPRGEPATYRITVDLDDAEPRIWRQLAVASSLRLDALLHDVGDTLLYAYDFGDGWDHTVRLDEVLPLPDGGAPARCTAGARACPPEDCGGTGGYEDLLAAAADPARLDPDERAELDHRLAHYFPSVPRSGIAAAATEFDLDQVNTLLARPPMPKPLADLLVRAHGPGAGDLIDLIERAGLDGPVLLDTAAAARDGVTFARAALQTWP
ncbi:plasmid pRiA4b ORF-3 family protein [Pengzhenrongella frigida]|uniref:Plasmid pRiA4b ORF-3 family protein n=1 Tax=Pengzhenrongella frigida TaxID=1259133 RepID=A0A4Q5MV81_9MICO|nr:plasmid pRiA4b ORF-3 family protein [Cellulomonas sp. HLT2-17]RYV49395.1 plasmid pRiA4b ORF-3 family protein [Cellulomonas sp. HLT2-17]